MNLQRQRFNEWQIHDEETRFGRMRESIVTIYGDATETLYALVPVATTERELQEAAHDYVMSRYGGDLPRVTVGWV